MTVRASFSAGLRLLLRFCRYLRDTPRRGGRNAVRSSRDVGHTAGPV